MGLDAEWLYEHLAGLLLHFVRAGAFFAIVPSFGSDAASRMLRLILAVSLGSILWWTTGMQVVDPNGVLDLIVMVTRELLIGLTCGFALRSITFLLSIAGEVIAHEMGFSMSRVMNPETGTSSTPMAQLFEIMGFMLIFQLNLHHDLLRVLRHTYTVIPVGQPFNYALVYERMTGILSRSIEYGLQYAIPIFGVMILLTVTLVVLARAVQNINLMEFSFGLRILLAFIAAIYFLVEGAPFLERVIEAVILDTRDMFDGA